MLVMGEQDHVDAAEVSRAAHGGRGLGQDRAARRLEVAGAVEGRVGEKAQAAVLEEGGRAAEDADGELLGHCGGGRHEKRTSRIVAVEP